MFHILAILTLLFSTSSLAGLKQQNCFDLGISAAPSMTPESGYSNIRLRLGIEMGMSFLKFEDESAVKVKGVSNPPATTFKLLRIGFATVATQPVFIFSPISILMKDKVYFSPTFGFGRDPYTLFSFSYELFP